MDEERLARLLVWRGERDLNALIEEIRLLPVRNQRRSMMETLSGLVYLNFNPISAVFNTDLFMDIPSHEKNLSLRFFILRNLPTFYNNNANPTGFDAFYTRSIKMMHEKSAEVVNRAKASRLKFTTDSLNTLLDLKFVINNEAKPCVTQEQINQILKVRGT